MLSDGKPLGLELTLWANHDEMLQYFQGYRLDGLRFCETISLSAELMAEVKWAREPRPDTPADWNLAKEESK